MNCKNILCVYSWLQLLFTIHKVLPVSLMVWPLNINIKNIHPSPHIIVPPAQSFFPFNVNLLPFLRHRPSWYIRLRSRTQIWQTTTLVQQIKNRALPQIKKVIIRIIKPVLKRGGRMRPNLSKSNPSAAWNSQHPPFQMETSYSRVSCGWGQKSISGGKKKPKT